MARNGFRGPVISRAEIFDPVEMIGWRHPRDSRVELAIRGGSVQKERYKFWAKVINFGVTLLSTNCRLDFSLILLLTRRLISFKIIKLHWSWLDFLLKRFSSNCSFFKWIFLNGETIFCYSDILICFSFFFFFFLFLNIRWCEIFMVEKWRKIVDKYRWWVWYGIVE